jgi:ribonuclease P protein component
LTEKKLISQIFKEGKSIFSFPLLAKYLPNPDASLGHHRVLISVSSKKIRKAADRNLLKRRIREAYRINYPTFPTTNHKLIAYIYVADQILPYQVIAQKLIESLNRFSQEK